MSHQDERRRLPRRRTRLSAVAVHGPDDAVIPCTVRDKSETGARLLIQTGSEAPDTFRLIELNAGVVHEARVVWRDQTFVGVTFSETTALAAAKTPEQRRYAQLCASLTGGDR